MIKGGYEKKRKRKDCILNSITYLSSAMSTIVLLAILLFMISKGSSLIQWDLLINDYWSKNYLVEVTDSENKPGEFKAPENMSADTYFSKKWGIALTNYVSKEQEEFVLVEYIAQRSPFQSLVDTSIKTEVVPFELKTGLMLQKLDYLDANGSASFTGTLLMQNAEDIVNILDQDVHRITSIHIKSTGGGIRGSILSTLYLILVSLLLALPIGIAAAIYLNEYAAKNKGNSWIRSAIEMLTGVPSIVYGLMGVTVLFPITQLFGATTTNILLGGMTLAIILLPTIIRSTEEALRVIPKSLRDASLSLGANQSQTIFKIILPCAIPGILTGVLLSIGRVIGESAALIYTMGSFINDSPNLLTQGTSLSVHIWSVMSKEQPNFELAAAISIIILIFVFILNFSIKWISKRLHKTWN